MLAIQTKPIPLQTDPDGTVRVTNTRIPLDTVVYAYRNGESAEEIVESFNALNLADVYAIISYYLDHQLEIDAYLQTRQTETEQLHDEIEKQFPSHGLRARLLARQRNHFAIGVLQP
jgi:uncharacterized protein (DUF433 family)